VAVRSEELYGDEQAVVYAFPTASVRTRVARARRAAVRRRRAGLALVGLSVVVMTLFGGGRAPASRASAPRAVVLAPGDTLWVLAERYAPDGVDPRAYVDAVVELNQLEGAPAAGLRLRLPR
jgi:hypothetical protein